MQDRATGEMMTIPAHEAKDREAQGFCVLRVGEVVEIKGGRFRVTAIGRKFMRLEGLPGSYIKLPNVAWWSERMGDLGQAPEEEVSRRQGE